MTYQLKYIGKGAFLPGVPARDLTQQEAAYHGGEKQLTDSGLYTTYKATKRPIKQEVKNG